MAYRNKAQDELLHRCQMFFGNIVLPDLAPRMAEVGVDTPQLEAGANLTTEVYNLAELQRQENRELDEAYDIYHNKQKVCDKHFHHMSKWSVAALSSDPERFRRLGFVPMEGTIKRRMIQALKCYNAMLADPIAMEALASHMITQEKINAEVTELSNVSTLERKILEAKGDAQMALQKRNAKIKELKAMHKKLEIIAKLVFEDEPQILEKLGIIVKS